MSAWFPKLVPHPSHTMRTPIFGDPYRKKCTDCGLTDLQDDVEMACLKAPTAERIAELEAALKAARYYLHHYAREASPSVGEMIASIDRVLPHSPHQPGQERYP